MKNIKISGIYKIINNINGKVYIGQSKNICARFGAHKGPYKKLRRGSLLSKKIEQYGLENFSFEILKETYDLDKWERFFIWWFRSNVCRWGKEAKGYNMTDGGQKNKSGYRHSEKDKKNIGKHSLIMWSKRENNWTWGKHTEEAKIKISVGNTKERYTEKRAQNISKTKSKYLNFICINTGEYFETIRDIYKKYPKAARHVRECIDGTRKSSGGLKWKLK